VTDEGTRKNLLLYEQGKLIPGKESKKNQAGGSKKKKVAVLGQGRGGFEMCQKASHWCIIIKEEEKKRMSARQLFGTQEMIAGGVIAEEDKRKLGKRVLHVSKTTEKRLGSAGEAKKIRKWPPRTKGGEDKRKIDAGKMGPSEVRGEEGGLWARK